MKVRKTLVAAVLLVTLAVALVVAGCNTVHGAGQDVERAGQWLQGK